MPKLILHIGTHKTGTTAIQAFLQANAEKLLEHGIDFPLFDVQWPERVLPNRNGYFMNRAALCRLSVDAKFPDRQIAIDCASKLSQRLRSRDDPTITTLLSDERMWYSGASNAAYWKAVKGVATNIGFDEIEVIVYLRRQDQFAESLWNQFVKATDKTESLDEYINSKRVRALCDYYAGVKRIEDVFGRTSVRIAVYDRKRLKNGDAVADFRHRIGLPLDGGFAEPSSQRDNPRLNNNLVELKRVVNRSVEYQQLNNAFGRGFAHAMLVDDWTEKTDMMGVEKRAAFLERFKRGNKLLAKEYFAGQQLFSSLKESDVPTWAFDSEAMLRDAVVVMADLIARQERRIRILDARVTQLEEQAGRGRNEAKRDEPQRRDDASGAPR